MGNTSRAPGARLPAKVRLLFFGERGFLKELEAEVAAKQQQQTSAADNDGMKMSKMLDEKRDGSVDSTSLMVEHWPAVQVGQDAEQFAQAVTLSNRLRGKRGSKFLSLLEPSQPALLEDGSALLLSRNGGISGRQVLHSAAFQSLSRKEKETVGRWLLACVAQGLKALHKKGFIHRAVNLDSAYLQPSTGLWTLGGHWASCCFDIKTRVVTPGTPVIRDPRYMQPEFCQVEEEYYEFKWWRRADEALQATSPRMDVYDLGQMVAELICGCLPPNTGNWDAPPRPDATATAAQVAYHKAAINLVLIRHLMAVNQCNWAAWLQQQKLSPKNAALLLSCLASEPSKRVSPRRLLWKAALCQEAAAAHRIMCQKQAAGTCGMSKLSAAAGQAGPVLEAAMCCGDGAAAGGCDVEVVLPTTTAGQPAVQQKVEAAMMTGSSEPAGGAPGLMTRLRAHFKCGLGSKKSSGEPSGSKGSVMKLSGTNAAPASSAAAAAAGKPRDKAARCPLFSKAARLLRLQR